MEIRDEWTENCRFSIGAKPSPPPPAEMHLSLGGPTSAWLKGLVVSGPEDWSFDLSSQFQSNVSDYGVIVPADFENATLCTQPFRGKRSDTSRYRRHLLELSRRTAVQIA